MDNNSLFSFRWYESLQFRLAAIFVILFFFIAVSVFMILKTFGDQIIEDEAFLRLNEANSTVISQLEKHTILSSTLVESMANLAETLPKDESLYKSLIPHQINIEGTQSFVAGGGIWPSPFSFDKKRTRNSFFWGRDKFGKLNFYDDYNLPEGNGYHNEEWYVPATHLLEGELYWSKSYIDPYSLQPMVTVSTPIIKDKQNLGVATIDLKLDGVQELLKQATLSFSGYAFVVDRNGTFLSYPEMQQVVSNVKKRDGSESNSFINYQTLTQNHPEFSDYSKILDKQRNVLLNNLKENKLYGKNLAKRLALDSNQITPQESELIVASILHSRSYRVDKLLYQQNLLLQNDPLLNEPVFVSVTIMPNTYWKIITVMPYSTGVEKISATYEQLMLSTLVALVITIFIIWLCIRYIVTSPITSLSHQIQAQLGSEKDEMQLITSASKGELSSLVNMFNQRTTQLLTSQRKVEKLAHFDTLTGLPNRRLLLNRLNEKLATCDRQHCYGALLFIDIDNFKLINDTLGHEVGDELLIHASERFTECVRQEDTVARLGGDEFVILIIKNHAYSRKLNNESTVVAQKLVYAMKPPIDLVGHPHHMSISIGITVFSNQNSNSDELLRQADTAMYRAKAKGKNGFCFFNAEMQQQANRRVEIEEMLRIALDKNELFLLYQPQVDKFGKCIGTEALVRWEHPEKGILSPAEFIGIAEESGLIIELGTWVLNESFAQLKAWHDKNIHIQKLSVNVSPKQFRQSDFINTVRDAINKHQLNASQITLEITEGIVIDDIQDTINKMTILQSLGVSLSIDDFGTGYSSLSYLKELPMNQLKIDQSFVRDIMNDPKDAMIVKTIISIANHLNLNVIAEGVENREQLNQLSEIGCEQFQGYYFSKPKSAEEFVKYFVTQTMPNVHLIDKKSS
ncbi:MAG: EAL domain-containing protein [Psychromonas sp.]|nr:EAL domain-containing protein [Psychromonas sp.]